jgi:HD-GYP domain-containing protein (c-di-GMP phosphodiesterase class II)
MEQKMANNGIDAGVLYSPRASGREARQAGSSGVVSQWPQKSSAGSEELLDELLGPDTIPASVAPVDAFMGPDAIQPYASPDDEILLCPSFLVQAGTACADERLPAEAPGSAPHSPDTRHDEDAVLLCPSYLVQAGQTGTDGPRAPQPAKTFANTQSVLHKLLGANSILRGLGPKAPPEVLPKLQPQSTVQKLDLRGELPGAIQAYDLVYSSIREHFPALLKKMTVDLPSLEYAVSNLVASLARNRDALVYLAQVRRSGAYLYTHAINVSIYSAAYTLDSGKSYSEAVATGLAGLLHDAGMLLQPPALLRSSQQLSATEQVLVKRHPIIAHEILSGMPNMPAGILAAVLEHHEHYDGKGYPYGSSGSRISFMGRLMAVAGTFDAMTSPRLHKGAVSAHAALGEMFKRKNTQFHPDTLAAFIRMIGIYPIGSAVTFEDGYCGIVSSATRNPTRPMVTLIQDPNGDAMTPLELDMSKEAAARIVHCGTPDEKGLDIYAFLGIPSGRE